jgi:hypothetical protein
VAGPKEGIELPLGMDYGGPLFMAHYSFSGLDPSGLRDRHANYWEQNVRHARINYAHCVANPHGHAGYGPDCWGLTSGHGPKGYVAHAPDRDVGVITPSAALASFPYLPDEAMRALWYFLRKPRHRIWGRFGFVDAFSESRNWYAKTYLAINQGPIVTMIENEEREQLAAHQRVADDVDRDVVVDAVVVARQLGAQSRPASAEHDFTAGVRVGWPTGCPRPRCGSGGPAGPRPHRLPGSSI